MAGKGCLKTWAVSVVAYRKNAEGELVFGFTWPVVVQRATEDEAGWDAMAVCQASGRCPVDDDWEYVFSAMDITGFKEAKR